MMNRFYAREFPSVRQLSIVISTRLKRFTSVNSFFSFSKIVAKTATKTSATGEPVGFGAIDRFRNVVD